MRKNKGIIFLFVCIAVFILIIGYMSQSAAPAVTTDQRKQDLVTLNSFECKLENHLLYCKGVVKNDDTRTHSVEGYIEVYDSSNNKYDDKMFNINVEAKGNATFEKTFTTVEQHPNSTFTYYISSVR